MSRSLTVSIFVKPPASSQHCRRWFVRGRAPERLGFFVFLIQRFQLFLEILIAHGFASRQRQRNGRGFSDQPCASISLKTRRNGTSRAHLLYFGFFPKISSSFGTGFVAAERIIKGFAAIEADEVSNKSCLRRRPFAVRAVHLPVDVAGINKQHRVSAVVSGVILDFAPLPQDGSGL